MSVAIQPAGSKASMQHYEHTIKNLVKISDYEKLINTDLEKLSEVSENGLTALWGVTPGTNNANVSKYKKLSVGDTVIFTRDKSAFATAQISYLFRNKLLAEKLWGKDNKDQTWEFMYALKNIENVNFSYKELQKAIHSKPGDNFMGFRVLDRQKSFGALELLGKPTEKTAWNIDVGEVIKRSDLHKTYGGAPYGGIEPSAKTPNVLIFTNPYKKSNFGYNFDEELEDGTFTYTGDGQEGDQNINTGGNKVILNHRKTRRNLRLFESTKTQTFVRYLGEFELGNPEYSIRRAPDRNNNERDVIVFNLNPVGVTKSIGIIDKEPVQGGIRKKTSEQSQNEKHSRKSYISNTFAERREIQLQDRYKTYITNLGQEIETIEISIPGRGTILKPDLVNFSTNEVIEVKSGVSRKYIREAIGQVLDYVFQIEKIENKTFRPTILVPGEISEDLKDLMKHLNISIVYEKTEGNFESLNN